MKNLPAICDETGSDESVLIGTREQMINLAESILKAVDSAKKESSWHNVSVKATRTASRLTDSMCDTSIASLVLVENESQRRGLVNRIRANCGDPEIDWTSIDENGKPAT